MERLLETTKTEEYVTRVYEVSCNRCKTSYRVVQKMCRDTGAHHSHLQDAEGERIHFPPPMFGASHTWGYGSPKDMETTRILLCEDCFDALLLPYCEVEGELDYPDNEEE